MLKIDIVSPAAMYTIGYDLLGKNADYSGVEAALGDLGATRVLESQWMVKLQNTTPKKLRRYLEKRIEAKHKGKYRLLVIRVSAGVNSRSGKSLLDKPE